MAKKARKAKKRGTRKRAVKAKKKKAARKKPGIKKAKKKPVKRKAAKAPRAKKLPSEPIGRVTHYFPHVKAGAIMIERDGIQVGDTLYFKGHTTRFKQTVTSLQINHQPVSQGNPGDEVGLLVKSRVREHDLVFKL